MVCCSLRQSVLFFVLRNSGRSYGTVFIPTALTLFIIAQKMNFVNLLKKQLENSS